MNETKIPALVAGAKGESGDGTEIGSVLVVQDKPTMGA